MTFLLLLVVNAQRVAEVVAFSSAQIALTFTD